MERRSSSNAHFIKAIKGSSETKICSVNSHGKPALMFKKLKDIYEGLTYGPHNSLHSSSEFSNNQVKVESQYLPVVVRKLREVEAADSEALPCDTDGGMGSDSDDYTFGKMTLKELKKDCKAKKRKLVGTQSFNPLHNEKKFNPEEDDSDLKEPLINWKLKVPKAKKRRSGSPKFAVLIKCEPQDLGSESPLQFQGDLLLAVHVTTEAAESEIKGCQNVISSADYSFTVNQKDESGVTEVMSKKNPFKVECQSSESNLCGKDNESCALNEVSYDHLENVEPLPIFLPSEKIMDVKDQEKWCQQFLHLRISEFEEEKKQSTLPVKDQSANCCARSCDLYEFSGHSSSNPAVVTPCTLVNNNISREETYHDCDSLHLQDPSSTDAELFFSKDDKSEEKQPLQGRNIDRVNNNLDNRTHLDVMEDELSSGEDRQPPVCASIDTENAERESTSCCKEFAFGETSSSTEAVQVPGRLLSTRKVVSPTSEERFCLAMNSAESYGDMELQDCKEDICNEEQTKIQSSNEGSDKSDNVSTSPQVSVAVSRMKFIQIRRKAKHERTSPPKGNIEGPRISRSLPSVHTITGCTSVQGCSKSAIAFSQRQMQDIESLAMKLISELKSMKDIVEEKLLFEAYRNLSSKYDADEVKDAITNATKAEEMAKKWLSMMGRDCNRFCKIMSLTQKDNTGVASNKTVQRDRKRITFADEAGGMLCHVKFFENGMTSPKPTSVKQDDGAR